MARVYYTAAGHRVEYDEPSKELETFLARLQSIADDTSKTSNDLIALMYSKENPILDKTMFPERGAITKEVLDNPVYSVMTDMLFRKEVATGSSDMEKIAERFSMTVAEAAELKGVHQSAIIKAIHAKRLPSWVKKGQYFLTPHHVESLEVGQRGSPARHMEPLEYKSGQQKNMMLRVLAPDGEIKSKLATVEGTIERWRKVGVLTGEETSIQFWIIEPSQDANEITAGEYFIKGKFRIVAKVSQAKKARDAFDTFRAS